MKKKILITLNTYTHYQLDFYISLKKYFKVKIYFLNLEYENYKFKFNDNKDFYYSKNILLKKLLIKENPDYLIFGGIKHSKLLNLNKDLKSSKIKYLFWLEKIKENYVRKKYYSYFHKKILNEADGILSVGNEAKKFYKQFNKNLLNLPYSINISEYKKTKIKPKTKLNFLYVGQYIYRKGLKEFISAIKMLSAKENLLVNFTFIGEGPYKKKLIKLKNKNKNVTIKNFQNRKSLKKNLNNNNIFVFPSLYDGWGVAPMEAIVSGLYLVISNQCGLVKGYPFIKKYSKIINPTSYDILKSIKFCIKNREKIDLDGKKLSTLIKRTSLNSNINAKNLSFFLNNL